jgi:hypothetical protein
MTRTHLLRRPVACRSAKELRHLEALKVLDGLTCDWS